MVGVYNVYNLKVGTGDKFENFVLILPHFLNIQGLLTTN